MALDAADRLELTALAMDYIDAVNVGDRRRWARCWAPDARWTIRDETIVGADAIVERWTSAMARFDRVVQRFGGIAIDDVDPAADSVVARVHFFEGLWVGDDPPVENHFTYHDRCLRTADGWRYDERRLLPTGTPLHPPADHRTPRTKET